MEEIKRKYSKLIKAFNALNASIKINSLFAPEISIEEKESHTTAKLKT